MFKYFNQPALDDAVAQGKNIRFSHNPTLKMYEKSAIRWELDYLKEHHLILEDLRECETSLSSLWEEVYEKVNGEKRKSPKKYNYHSL